jgi:hypothetical protein
VSGAHTGSKSVDKHAFYITDNTFWRSLRHCPHLYVLASFRNSGGEVDIVPCTRLGSKLTASDVEVLSSLLVEMGGWFSTSPAEYRALALPKLRKVIPSCRWRTRSRPGCNLGLEKQYRQIKLAYSNLHAIIGSHSLSHNCYYFLLFGFPLQHHNTSRYLCDRYS